MESACRACHLFDIRTHTHKVAYTALMLVGHCNHRSFSTHALPAHNTQRAKKRLVGCCSGTAHAHIVAQHRRRIVGDESLRNQWQVARRKRVALRHEAESETERRKRRMYARANVNISTPRRTSTCTMPAASQELQDAFDNAEYTARTCTRAHCTHIDA